MPAKPMAPFPVYPPRLCENPDCQLGDDAQRKTFTPRTPWQSCCSKICAARKNYLRWKSTQPPAARKPGRPKKKSEESGT